MNISVNSTFLTLCVLRVLCESFITPAYAQVNIVEAPSNTQFVDIGYDSTTDTVAMVGTVNGIATVFQLNEAGDGFDAQTLANLPGATSNAIVNSISSDASRIAGSSSSDLSTDLEGATWLRNGETTQDGITPERIGFVDGFTNSSGAVGAWADGVVGSSGGLLFPVQWDFQNGIQILPGTEGGGAGAQGVSANGEIAVGVSSHEVFGGAAYYWDSSGIHRLNDEVEGFITENSVARRISPDGNFIGGEIILTDSQFNLISAIAIWEGPERTLRLLTDSNGDLVQGNISDVSNLGYAVGTYFSPSFEVFGYIWNPEFSDGVRDFDDWFLEEYQTVLPFSTIGISAIAEGDGQLFFLPVGSNAEFAFLDVVIDSDIPTHGDVNLDGVVNLLDVSPFVEILVAAGFQEEADVNDDGFVDLLDVAPFVDILAG